jgi:hypothetical protein
MNNRKYHTVETVPKPNNKILERGKTPNTQIYDRYFSVLGTGISIKKNGGAKLVL